MRHRAVIFDLYDTLVWSDWPAHATLIADQLGVHQSAVVAAYDRLREHRDGGGLADAEAILIAVARACEVDATEAEIARLVALEADFLTGTVHWYEDSLPTLRRLRESDVPTAVISNCSPTTRPVVDRLGVEAEVDAVILSCEVGAAKPSPEIFTTALDRLSVPASAALFVDDRADYLDGAAAVGIDTLRIERDHSFGESLPPGNHPVVTDLQGLA